MQFTSEGRAAANHERCISNMTPVVCEMLMKPFLSGRTDLKIVQLRRSATGRLRCNSVTRWLSVALRHLHGLQNKVKFNAEHLRICRPKTLKVDAMIDGIDEEPLIWLLEIADFKMGRVTFSEPMCYPSRQKRLISLIRPNKDKPAVRDWTTPVVCTLYVLYNDAYRQMQRSRSRIVFFDKTYFSTK